MREVNFTLHMKDTKDIKKYIKATHEIITVLH